MDAGKLLFDVADKIYDEGLLFDGLKFTNGKVFVDVAGADGEAEHVKGTPSEIWKALDKAFAKFEEEPEQIGYSLPRQLCHALFEEAPKGDEEAVELLRTADQLGIEDESLATKVMEYLLSLEPEPEEVVQVEAKVYVGDREFIEEEKHVLNGTEELSVATVPLEEYDEAMAALEIAAREIVAEAEAKEEAEKVSLLASLQAMNSRNDLVLINKPQLAIWYGELTNQSKSKVSRSMTKTELVAELASLANLPYDEKGMIEAPIVAVGEPEVIESRTEMDPRRGFWMRFAELVDFLTDEKLDGRHYLEGYRIALKMEVVDRKTGEIKTVEWTQIGAEPPAWMNFAGECTLIPSA